MTETELKIIEKIERTNDRIDHLKQRFEKRFTELENKFQTLIESLKIFTAPFNNNKGFRPYLLLMTFIAGGVANMIGIYTLVKTIINLIFKR